MKVSKITRLLPFLMLAALLLGGILGKVAASYPEELSGFVAVSGWVGAAFLNILKMVIGPLILSSIITGVAGMGSASNLGRIGGKTIGLFLGTTVVAIVLGLFLVNIIKPGIGVNLLADPSANEVVVENLVAEQQNVGEILMDAIPSNITKAFVEDNMLQIIVFAILFGLFTTKIGHEQSKKILDFFSAVFHVMMKLTSAIIKLTPIGILGITVEQVARKGDVGALVSSLLLFLVTVFAGILIHFFVIIPLLRKYGIDTSYIKFEDMLVFLQGKVDFLGLNVYNRFYITDYSAGETEVFHNNKGAGSNAKEGIRIRDWYETAIDPNTKRNLWGREIYPKCMYNTLMEIKERYGEIPVYITENGHGCYETPDENGVVQDDERIEMMQ